MSEEAIALADPLDKAALEGCFRVISVLRPHLDLAEFLRRFQVQQAEGYRLAYVAQDGAIAAVAGFRIAHYMAWGRVLYVDDLVTDPQYRRRGLSGRLLDWLIAEARRESCDALHLDSGYQRNDAHRLYLNKGMVLSSHHFALEL